MPTSVRASTRPATLSRLCVGHICKSRPHEFDLVQGPIANDKVFTTVNLFESGVLSAEAAILQLKAYKTYDQLSFHTDRVIKTLNFVESIEV